MKWFCSVCKQIEYKMEENWDKRKLESINTIKGKYDYDLLFHFLVERLTSLSIT